MDLLKTGRYYPKLFVNFEISYTSTAFIKGIRILIHIAKKNIGLVIFAKLLVQKSENMILI